MASLTATSGAFWTDLQATTLPSVSWITPNPSDDGENPCGGCCALAAAYRWLQSFTGIVQSSPEYQAGTTLMFITYDERTGTDSTVGEDCTNKGLDMPVIDGISAHQDSCHIPSSSSSTPTRPQAMPMAHSSITTA